MARREVIDRAVIVDRDGTLIDFYRDGELGVVTPAFHPEQAVLLPGVVEGLRALRDAAYAIAIATNQPDAAKGRTSVGAIERTNRALVEALERAGIEVAALRVCFHHPEGGPGGDPALVGPCACRKPKPGMLLGIAAELGVDPRRCWMIGDTAGDLRAADAAGMRCALLVERGRCEICPLAGAPLGGLVPAATGPSLEALAAAILAAG